nr:EAL domain-containing protein [uncultured Cohaesibacter sp.]
MNPFQYRSVQEFWPLFGAALFLAISSFVAFHMNETHKSMLSLANQNFLNATQIKVEDVELHFDRLQQTAERIAASHALSHYIARKDKEPVDEAAIAKSVEKVEQRFYNFLRKSNSLENNVYSYVAYFDRQQNLIASVGEKTQFNEAVDPSSKFAAQSIIDIDRKHVVSFAPVYHNDIYEGRVVTISAFNEIQDLLRFRVTKRDILVHLVFQDGKLFLGPDGMADTNSPYLTAYRQTTKTARHVRHDIQATAEQGQMVGVSIPLRNVPASIFALQPKGNLAGGAVNDNYAVPLFGISIFMFILTIGFNQLRRKNLRLKEEFGIINKHRALLADKNDELKQEIDRRKLAENEIKTKTLELEAMNIDLQIAATAFDSIEAMAVIDSDRMILKVNSALLNLLQYDKYRLLKTSLNDLLERQLEIEDAYSEFWLSIETGQGWQGEVRFRNKSGMLVERWLAVSPVLDETGTTTHHILTFYDLSVQKRAEERVRQLAFFDQLTGLPNRSLLIDRLQNALKVNAKKGTFSAIMFLDLDNFKSLNDTLGHDAGDELLMAAAQRLQASVGAEQTVARFGGDEFVILMPSLAGETASEAALDAEIFSFSVLDAFEQSFQLCGIEHRCTTSIGIATFGPDDSSYEEILKHADIAMYQAKKDGRNIVRFFDPELQEDLADRMKLEQDLHLAINNEDLKLFYQPQISSKGAVTGAEALVRWPHPELGFVPPSVFIPIAESCGLITRLGNWILETACDQLAAWQDHPAMEALTLSVNVSAIQLHRFDFVDGVLGALERSGAPARKLKLEITESLLVDKAEEVIGKMELLRKRGVCFSLDDFGTGYSSLFYLKKLPLDQLKIDQSFVQALPHEPNDVAIAKTIVALSQTLELSVIAEGVENEQQRDFLQSIGCNEFQGYLFARPMPQEQYEDFVRLFSANKDNQTQTKTSNAR